MLIILLIAYYIYLLEIPLYTFMKISGYIHKAA